MYIFQYLLHCGHSVQLTQFLVSTLLVATQLYPQTI